MKRARFISAIAKAEIQASPQVVFKWVSDPERVPLWVRDLVESRPLPGEQLGVGARSVEVLRVGRRRVDVPAEVTALELDRLIEIRLESPEGPCLLRTVISPTPTGSAVTQTMEASFDGMRLMPSFLLRRLVNARLQSDLKRLKALVERSTG